jgi:uncharacterized protein DUF3500
MTYVTTDLVTAASRFEARELLKSLAMERRQAIKWLGIGAVGAAAAVAGRRTLFPPSRSAHLASVDSLAVRLFDSFDGDTRAAACVTYDHPLRQYHNRGVPTGGLKGSRFNWEQRQILTDLLYAGLSAQGRERIPDEMLISGRGVHALEVLVCGDPRTPPYQIMLSGPHLNLRLGGRSREGVAFGGPQVYGDQRGNTLQGMPGNHYRYQFQMAHRLFASLSSAQQVIAIQPRAPIQTQIELNGTDFEYTGVPIATLSNDSKALARTLVDGILSTYSLQDVEYAWKCLDSNGGLDALHLTYYADGNISNSGQYQIFRLEGPAAVLYFRGWPHLHAFINVAMNPNAPLSVGEVVGENPSVLEGAAVKALFEQAMRTQTGADSAYYDPQDAVGRLRKGTIRTGDIYNLESWRERVVVGELTAALVPPDMKLDLDSTRKYVFATSGYTAQRLVGLKALRGAEQRMMLRDATIQHAKRHGFSGPGDKELLYA